LKSQNSAADETDSHLGDGCCCHFDESLGLAAPISPLASVADFALGCRQSRLRPCLDPPGACDLLRAPIDVQPIRTILVPTDFSDGSRCAAQYAADLAKSVGARITLVHVFHMPSPAYGDSVYASVVDTIPYCPKRRRLGLTQLRGSNN
jgi:hypothetical protein